MVTTDQRLHMNIMNSRSFWEKGGSRHIHYEREERFVGLIAGKESKELHR